MRYPKHLMSCTITLAHTLAPLHTVRCLDRDTAGDCVRRAVLSGSRLRYPKHACMRARGYVRAPCPDEARQAVYIIPDRRASSLSGIDCFCASVAPLQKDMEAWRTFESCHLFQSLISFKCHEGLRVFGCLSKAPTLGSVKQDRSLFYHTDFVRSSCACNFNDSSALVPPGPTTSRGPTYGRSSQGQ